MIGQQTKGFSQNPIKDAFSVLYSDKTWVFGQSGSYLYYNNKQSHDFSRAIWNKWALQIALALALVQFGRLWKKCTRSYLFKIALEIMWLPILINLWSTVCSVFWRPQRPGILTISEHDNHFAITASIIRETKSHLYCWVSSRDD